MQLANLDNEVFFKKVFTDPDVFRAFVKDITGVDIVDAKIETEKRLVRKVAAINFKLDIYAESLDKRIVIEIQRVDYDYSFDRFIHYFLALLVDLQRSSKDYSFDQDVYTIVMLTSPYVVKEKTGELIKDDVLITDLNPRTLANKIRQIYPHKLIFLNPNYSSPETPVEIQDWLEFILTSIKNPTNPKYNQSNVGIAKAALLADMENMPESVLEDAKIAEARNKTTKIHANLEHEKGKREGKEEGKREGKEEGKREGKEEAEKEAREEAKRKEIAMIVSMDATGIAINQIAMITQKTEQEISEIIAIHRN
jgi:PD-(D/E)XK nuclease family transposase